MFDYICQLIQPSVFIIDIVFKQMFIVYLMNLNFEAELETRYARIILPYLEISPIQFDFATYCLAFCQVMDINV